MAKCFRVDRKSTCLTGGGLKSVDAKFKMFQGAQAIQKNNPRVGSNPTAISIFPKTSIKQYLPEPAMLTLVPGDLEINSISIVTPVDDHQSFNTAVEVLRGEEGRMANVLTV